MKQRLDVARHDAALAEEPSKRGVCGIALDSQDLVGGCAPEHAGEAKERAVSAVVVNCAANPCAGGQGGLECGNCVIAGDWRGQLHHARWRCNSLRHRGARRGNGLLAGKSHETTGHARETERGEGLRNLNGVKGGKARVGEVKLDGGVRADGCHATRDERVLHVSAQILAHLALDLVGMRDDLVERAVLHDQRRSLLGANAGNAGDVVGGVALEAVEVRHKFRRDAVVEVLHRGGVHDHHVRDALLGGDDLHVLGGELVHVTVAGEEVHVVAGRLAAARQGAEDVVALPALELGHGDVERAQELLHHRELLVQRRVHRWALGLVLGQHLHAHARLALVEGADHAVGAEGVHHLDEHVEEAEERARGAAVWRRHGLADRVEGAVHERVAVDDGDGAGDV